MSEVITVRCYEELCDHLPPQHRRVDFLLPLRDNESPHRVLENLRIPLEEVDLILLNGHPVPTGAPLRENDRLALYPTFESLDVSGVSRIRSAGLRYLRLAVELPRLAVALRVLGFDTIVRTGGNEREWIERVRVERRVLMAREALLQQRHALTHCLVLQESRTFGQIREILQRIDLWKSIRPWTHCPRCNAGLHEPPATPLDSGNVPLHCATCGPLLRARNSRGPLGRPGVHFGMRT